MGSTGIRDSTPVFSRLFFIHFLPSLSVSTCAEADDKPRAETAVRLCQGAMKEILARPSGYITVGDTPREVSPVKVDSTLKSIDLMHFGCNIGKALGKKRIHTSTFIKNVFAQALRVLEISTIERKMLHTESECRIRLDGMIG